jgi:hypothetical protein
VAALAIVVGTAHLRRMRGSSLALLALPGLLLVNAGCSTDLVSTVDFGPDIARAPDLAPAVDLAVPDLAVPPDLASPDIAVVEATDLAVIAGAGCGHWDGGAFPQFPRNCSSDNDCAIADHQWDCCGTIRALGIRQDALPAFKPYEAAWEKGCFLCGCPEGPPMADDGSRGWIVGVTCQTGLCTTHTK